MPTTSSRGRLRTNSYFGNAIGGGGQAGVAPVYDNPDAPLFDNPTEPPPPDPTPVDYGGGGGGSGVYDYTTDPVYQAYIANLDLNQAQQQATTARRRDYLMADQTRLLDETGRTGEQNRESISGGYESRGLFNSGGRLRDISRQQANQGSREGNIREGTARNVAELEAELANNLAQAQLKRQQAQLGVFQ